MELADASLDEILRFRIQNELFWNKQELIIIWK